MKKWETAIILVCVCVLFGIPSRAITENTISFGRLLSDLIDAYENGLDSSRIDEDLSMLQDDIADAVAEHWKKTYLDPEYHLFVYGKDNPSAVPIRGRNAIVVLGYELKDGEMTEELIGRCDAAAALASAFPDSILVCSGGATGKNNPEKHTEAGLMKEYLAGCGVEPARIFTDESAMTTAENAVNTFVILQSQGIETMTIVTSSYHQRWGQALYNLISAQYRKEQNYYAEIVGNFCYETEPSNPMFLQDDRIAVSQMGRILDLSDEEMSMLPRPSRK